MSTELSNPGVMIRSFRNRLIMTVDQLAEKSGLATGTIGNYENNRNKPRQSHLSSLVEALKLDKDERARLIQAIQGWPYLREGAARPAAEGVIETRDASPPLDPAGALVQASVQPEAAARHERDTREAESGDRPARLSEADERYDRLAAERDTLSARLSSLTAKYEDASQRLADLERERDHLTAELNEHREQIEHQRSALEADLLSTRTELERLKSRRPTRRDLLRDALVISAQDLRQLADRHYPAARTVSLKVGAAALAGAVAQSAYLFLRRQLSPLPPHVAIVSSLPESRDRLLTGQLRAAIDQAIAELPISGVTVHHITADNAKAMGNTLDPWAEELTVAENAINNTYKVAVNNREEIHPKVLSYIGPFNSGAAQKSLDKLYSSSLLTICFATYTGLTKNVSGIPLDEPEIYYPNRRFNKLVRAPSVPRHNFIRVTPRDEIQGAAAAAWCEGRSKAHAYVLYGDSPYGLGLAKHFIDSTRESRYFTIANINRDPTLVDWSGSQEDIAEFVRSIKGIQTISKNKIDTIFYAGLLDPKISMLWNAIRIEFGDILLMGGESLYTQQFIDYCKGIRPDLADGTWVSIPAVPPQVLRRVSAEHRVDPNRPEWLLRYDQWLVQNQSQLRGSVISMYVPFAYEAARIALTAIRAAGCADRQIICEEALKIAGPSILGEQAFDADGDTTLHNMSIVQVRRGTFDPSSAELSKEALNVKRVWYEPKRQEDLDHYWALANGQRSRNMPPGARYWGNVREELRRFTQLGTEYAEWGPARSKAEVSERAYREWEAGGSRP